MGRRGEGGAPAVRLLLAGSGGEPVRAAGRPAGGLYNTSTTTTTTTATTTTITTTNDNTNDDDDNNAAGRPADGPREHDVRRLPRRVRPAVRS